MGLDWAHVGGHMWLCPRMSASSEVVDFNETAFVSALGVSYGQVLTV